jgi:DNA adenine methylase
MKTPITYYGGKQTLLKYILPLIPAHKLYCEPFFGGGAVFFAKPPSEVEVINDSNGEIVNFFQVVKKKFAELQKEIQATPHSRELYKKAMVVYEYPDLFTDVKRAWALWVLTNQGFAGMIGSWGFGKDNAKEKSLLHKREDFAKNYAQRLERVQIEQNDALKVLARCDDKESFIYCDPPYIGSDMGHYAGYTEEDYKALLNFLAKTKAKFLLSSYPSKILNAYIKKYKWRVRKISKHVSVTKHTEKVKTEMLVFNYEEKRLAANSSPNKKTPSALQLEKSLKQLKFAA